MGWSVKDRGGQGYCRWGTPGRRALVFVGGTGRGAPLAARLRLVLQLARCPYVSSEALRLFLQIARRVERQGGRFALAAPNGDVDRALRVSGVSRLVKVVPSPEELGQEAKASEQLARLAKSFGTLGPGRWPAAGKLHTPEVFPGPGG
ncbi:MAG: STAS domain-containing protein [Thermoanaerobaculaceae bacterium]